MRHSADTSPVRSHPAGGSPFFAVTVVLAFLSLILFGYGAFLHTIVKTAPAIHAAHTKPLPHTRHGRRAATAPTKTVPAAATKSGSSATGEDRAFQAMLAGGIGLLLSALLGLGLIRRLQAIQVFTVHSLLEVEKAAWNKQRSFLDTQREKLSAQLREAQQDKAEVEHLRKYSSRQFQEFFRTLPVACFCFAADGKIVRWNAACETLYGIPASEAMDSTLWETIVPEEEREAITGWMNLVLAGQSVLDVERRDRNAHGTTFLVRCSMVPLRGVDGEIIGGLSAGIDLTEIKQFEREVAERDANLQEVRTQLQQARATLEAQQRETEHLQSCLAEIENTEEAPAAVPPPDLTRDMVTGLYSHRTFRERLREETERAHRYQTPLSVIVFDLDQFGAYNQAQGFEAGDLALQTVAALVESKIRTVDVAARCDADTYALILPETGEAGTRVAVDRLRSGIAGLEWSPQPLTACFGIALLEPDVSSPEALLARAFDSLRGAKSLGPNTIAYHGEASFPTIRKIRRKETTSQPAH